MIKSPVFIVGAERSGSTMLRLMLDSHSEVTGCEGFEFIAEMVGDDGARPELAEYHEYLSRHAIFGSSGLKIDQALSYDELVNSFFSQRLELSGKTQVVSMVHFHFSRLLALWPEARFIHLVRDPRDVTSSVIQMGWAGTVWHGLDKWIESENEWSDFSKRLDATKFVELRYSDLIADHVSELKKVCGFLGVDYSDEMMSYADETDYSRPDPSRVEAWKSKLTDVDLALVEGRVGKMMVDRGFELSGGPLEQPGGTDKIKLNWQNRLAMWNTRIERYGARLFIEGLAAKVVPIDSYKKSVTLRYNKIERANRKKSWREPGREYSVSS